MWNVRSRSGRADFLRKHTAIYDQGDRASAVAMVRVSSLPCPIDVALTPLPCACRSPQMIVSVFVVNKSVVGAMLFVRPFFIGRDYFTVLTLVCWRRSIRSPTWSA